MKGRRGIRRRGWRPRPASEQVQKFNKERGEHRRNGMLYRHTSFVLKEMKLISNTTGELY